MKITSFDILKSNNRFLEDKEEYYNIRENLLIKYKYSLIIEADFSEIEELDNWIILNIGNREEKWDSYFYFKESYDYGYCEYFILGYNEIERIKSIIPQIYGILGNGKKYRTNGYNEYNEIE